MDLSTENGGESGEKRAPEASSIPSGTIVIADLTQPKDKHADAVALGINIPTGRGRSVQVPTPVHVQVPDGSGEKQKPETRLRFIGGWWENDWDLNDVERQIMLRIFSNAIDVELTGNEFDLTVGDVYLNVQNALAKQLFVARRGREDLSARGKTKNKD